MLFVPTELSRLLVVRWLRVVGCESYVILHIALENTFDSEIPGNSFILPQQQCIITCVPNIYLELSLVILSKKLVGRSGQRVNWGL